MDQIKAENELSKKVKEKSVLLQKSINEGNIPTDEEVMRWVSCFYQEGNDAWRRERAKNWPLDNCELLRAVAICLCHGNFQFINHENKQ